MRCDAYRNDEAARCAMLHALHAEAAERAALLGALLGTLPAVGDLPVELRELRDRLRALPDTDDSAGAWAHGAALESALRDADAILARRRALEAWGKRVRNLRCETALAEARLRQGGNEHRSALGETLCSNAAGPLAAFVLLALTAAAHPQAHGLGAAVAVASAVYIALVAADPRRRRARRALDAAHDALADAEGLLAREVGRRDVL